MFNSLHPSTHWDMPPKSRLSAFLAQQPVRTRIAPSPTGHVHLGTVRTALHNYLAARASGGQFVLRIDDTDDKRNDASHVDLIHHCLDLFQLKPDLVFHQSARRDHHQQAAQVLLDKGWAVQDGNAVRLAPQARSLAPSQFFDLASGVCTISDTFLDQADNLVLMRSDGSPTYHFASIVDDIDTHINLIIRGMDHLSNVPKQLIIASALAQANYPNAQHFLDHLMWAHVGLIMHQKKKLSKRDDASNVLQYLQQGVDPGVLLQWALPLGWGHPDAQFDRHYPVLTLDDMPDVFAQGGLRSSNCNLNGDKLPALMKKWKARFPQ